MNVFLAHVGSPGNRDIAYTVTRRRSIDEMLRELPLDAPERPYFATDVDLRTSFPDWQFNCWGVPRGAERVFRSLDVGDLVLFAPTIGLHGGGIRQLGVVRAVCPVASSHASHILWPLNEPGTAFPLVFFFDTEVGFRAWFDYLDDISYKKAFNPRGKFLPVKSERFEGWGGPSGYLHHLRHQHGFVPLA